MTNSISTLATSRTGRQSNLPAEITRRGSRQTYYTFRLLVGRRRLPDAYRAYAYFRWLDDQLDCNSGPQAEKLALLERQTELMKACYNKQVYPITCPEEQMLVDLVESNCDESSGVKIYLHNMMAVMSFDMGRKGRLINQAQLAHYSHMLSTAVTELLFYLIGPDDPAPRNPERYQAVCGAHIAHMLRDLLDDIDHGYINLPAELLESHLLSVNNVNSPAFRMWVKERVKLAQQCFSTGRKYFKRVKSLRCRLAAHFYLARFEWILMAIERDGYRLRRSYPERKGLRAGLWMAWRVIRSILNITLPGDINRPLALPD